MTRYGKLRMGAICLSAIWLPQMAIAQTVQNNAEKSTSSSSSVRLSTGISYSNGDYGELQDTEVLAVPVSLTFKTGNVRFRVSVPYVRVNGPGSLLQTPDGGDSGGGGGGGGRGRGRGGDSSGRDIEVEDLLDNDIVDDDAVVAGNKRSGIGDVNVSLMYSLGLGSGFYIEPSAKVKLPTASKSKRLGSGKTDFTLSSDFVKEIGAASIYVHGRRKFAGKATGSTIRSTWGAGAGASIDAGETVTIGGDYDWQQSAFAGRGASSEVTGWVNFRVTRRASLNLYAGTGLNDNSASLIGGATVSYRF